MALIERSANPPVVVIAPDRHEKGTNALLMSPAGLIEYDFGENSFERHCELARKAGARLEIVKIHSLGWTWTCRKTLLSWKITKNSQFGDNS